MFGKLCCYMLSQYNVSATSGNVRPVQNNAEQILNYENLTYNSTLFSVTAHLCAEASCPVVCRWMMTQYILTVFCWFIWRWDATAVSSVELYSGGLFISQRCFLLQRMESPQKCVANECVSAIWRMEEDDVTIREQNFHSQVREYIVSNLTEKLIRVTYAHCVPHFNSHLDSFTYTS